MNVVMLSNSNVLIIKEQPQFFFCCFECLNIYNSHPPNLSNTILNLIIFLEKINCKNCRLPPALFLKGNYNL